MAAIRVKFLSSDQVCLAGGCGWVSAATNQEGLQASHEKQGKATSGHTRHVPGIDR